MNNYHYTQLGNIPIVVSYSFHPSVRLFNDDLEVYEQYPAYITINDVFINGQKTGSLSGFSNSQLTKWETEIMDYFKANL